MSLVDRVRRAEASLTVTDSVIAVLDVATGYPNASAWVAACLAPDPPIHPAELLRDEVAGRLARAPQLRTAVRRRYFDEVTDAFVLYRVARAMQDEADRTGHDWHAIAHLRLLIKEAIAERPRSAFDAEEREWQLQLLVPAAVTIAHASDLRIAVRRSLERQFFRGRDVRFPDTREWDDPLWVERGLLDLVLDKPAVVGSVPGARVAQVTSAEIRDGVRRRLDEARLGVLIAGGDLREAAGLARTLSES